MNIIYCMETWKEKNKYREMVFWFQAKNRSSDGEKLWDQLDNFFKQWKVKTVFETEYFSNLLLETFTDLIKQLNTNWNK